MKKKRIITLLLVLVLLCTMLAGCGEEKVDLRDYYSITFYGEDGQGTANCQRNISEFEHFLLGDDDDMVGLARIAAIESTMDYELSETSGLSNGDEVTLTITWDPEVVAQYGYKFTNGTITATVEGLE